MNIVFSIWDLIPAVLILYCILSWFSNKEVKTIVIGIIGILCFLVYKLTIYFFTMSSIALISIKIAMPLFIIFIMIENDNPKYISKILGIMLLMIIFLCSAIYGLI